MKSVENKIAAAVGVGILTGGLVVSLLTPEASAKRPLPACAGYDRPMVERLYTGCVKAMAEKISNAPYVCRSEAMQMSCNAWTSE